MKNSQIIISYLLILVSISSFALNSSDKNNHFNNNLPLGVYLNSTDFFVGKWKVQVDGTPNGDVVMNVEIKKVDGKYVGSVQTDGSGPEPIKADKIEIKNNELIIYWLAGGYNVYLQLEKVKANTIVGSLMDMFDAKGERIVE